MTVQKRRPVIDIIAGARPNFMKIASIISAMKSAESAGGTLRYRLVHTGQHYDARMSGDFFAQLNIPEPDVNLEVGSGTQAEQTSAIMVRYEKLLAEQPSDLCVVVGDVNSTMACSITAKKAGLKVAHVEGGLRSGDWTMPEEVNRVVTDSISDLFFTTSEVANQHLRESGVSDDRIYFVGNTMIDTLNENMGRIKPPSFWKDLGLEPQNYFIVTLHRPSNVDELSQLLTTLAAIAEGARGQLVVFPVHPRTAKTLLEARKLPGNVRIVEPQPYLEFIYLTKHAKAVVTDSGGITEETTVMGVPCMTLRTTTERPETVTVGTNELIGTDPAALKPAFDRLFDNRWKKGAIPAKWDGKAGERIVAVLQEVLGNSEE
jgi:UDP-N-acetylglucosamine 2-epimerase (non-hydrolysing)